MNGRFAITMLLASFLAGGCSALIEGDEPKATPTATVTSSPSPTAPDERVLTFNAFVDEPTEVDAKLPGTSDAFRAFIAAEVKRIDAEAARECPGYFSAEGVKVERYMPAGFAMGGSGACGGGVAIWAETSSAWKQVLGGQAAFACDDFRKHDIPAQLLRDPRCMEGTELVNYTG